MEKYNKISTRKFMKDLKEIDIFNAGMTKKWWSIDYCIEAI